MVFAKIAVRLLALAGIAVLASCSAEQKTDTGAPESATLDSRPADVTPEATVQPEATPSPTPDDRSRTARVAEHQRRVRELMRQRQQNKEQPPGSETQYE